MLTGRSKRACLCREVPTDHEAHGQTQRWLQNSKRFGGTYARRTKQYTRSTIEVMLKPFARARNDVDANQSSCALRSHTFTRRARRERTVALVSPADHAQHVRTARSSTDEETADSVNLAVMVERMIQVTNRQKSGPTAGEKSSANSRRERALPTADNTSWRSGHDHPNDRLQRVNRGVQEPELHRAEGHRDDSLRGQMRNEDHMLLEGGPVRILGGTWTE